MRPGSPQLGTAIICALALTGVSSAAPRDPGKVPTGAARAADARNLPADATFRDLIRAARKVRTPAQTGADACLLRGGTAGTTARLEAHLDAKIAATLDDPRPDLDMLLTDTSRPGTVRIVAGWGQSDGGGLLDLATFTPVSRAISVTTPILLVTDQGIYFTFIDSGSRPQLLGAVDRARLRGDFVPHARARIVAAEGDAPIARLREALDLVAGTPGTVSLASPLTRESSGLDTRHSRFEHEVRPAHPMRAAVRRRARRAPGARCLRARSTGFNAAISTRRSTHAMRLSTRLSGGPFTCSSGSLPRGPSPTSASTRTAPKAPPRAAAWSRRRADSEHQREHQPESA